MTQTKLTTVFADHVSSLLKRAEKQEANLRVRGGYFARVLDILSFSRGSLAGGCQHDAVARA